MRKLAPWLLLVCLGALPVSADTVIEEIVARVNNQIITRSEFLHSKEQLKQEAQQQDPANADKLYSQREKDDDGRESLTFNGVPGNLFFGSQQLKRDR